MDLLYAVTIAPLEYFYRFCFLSVSTVTGSYAFGLLFLSLCNILIFIPLSKLTGAVEGQEKKIQDILAPQIESIKKASTGSARHLRIKGLYRRYAYHPLYAARSAFGVFLQLPFLFAAYRMLSSLPDIHGERLLFLADLSQPDQLLWGINLLPLLMTGINLATTFFSRDFSAQAKKQAIAVALLFAVLLYNAPAALLVFWTLNNLFYLCKAVLPTPQFSMPDAPPRFKTWVLNHLGSGADNRLFAVCVLCLIALAALFCPAALALSDPEFFLFGLYPVFLETVPMCFACAIPVIFIWAVLPPWARSAALPLILACTVLALLFCFVLVRDYGTLSGHTLSNASARVFKQGIPYDLAAYGIVAALLIFLYIRKKIHVCVTPALVVTGALCCYTGYALLAFPAQTPDVPSGSQTPYRTVSKNTPGKTQNVSAPDRPSPTPLTNPGFAYPDLVDPAALPEYAQNFFTFSTTQPNVLVLFLDMFTGGHMEDMLREDSSLAAALDGFTWYPDTMATGGMTIFSLPGMFGGEAYTPPNMNKRPQHTNLAKWNEALAVMPRNFAVHDYDVALFNVCYYNRQLFDAHIPQPHTVTGIPELGPEFANAMGIPLPHFDETKELSLFTLQASLFRMVPHMLKEKVYEEGKWGGAAKKLPSSNYKRSVYEAGLFTALPHIAKARDTRGTMRFYWSMLPHILWHLEKDRFAFSQDPYPETEGQHVLVDGIIPEHYFSERHIMRMLLPFFQWMKKNGVYDNTLIILASDHCDADSRMLNTALGADDSGSHAWGKNTRYPGRPHALLLVKEPAAHGPLSISDSLLATSDIPALICSQIGGCPEISPLNLSPDRLRYHYEGYWRFEGHPEKIFDLGPVHRVNGTMFNNNNWQKVTLEGQKE